MQAGFHCPDRTIQNRSHFDQRGIRKKAQKDDPGVSFGQQLNALAQLMERFILNREFSGGRFRC